MEEETVLGWKGREKIDNNTEGKRREKRRGERKEKRRKRSKTDPG